jgi:hypothetical protein
VLDALLAKQRGAANAADVGSPLVSGSRTFGIKIFSNINAMMYEFKRCYLQADGQSDSQWGNRERVLTLNLSAIPDSNVELFTYTAQA